MNMRATCATNLAMAGGLLLWSAATLAQEPAANFQFSANLAGAQEVVPPDAPTTPSPGVTTTAVGSVQITVPLDFSSLTFQLQVNNGTGVTQAHLHCGRPGENGPIVLFLSPLNATGADVNGVLAEGTRANTDLEAGATDCETLIGRPVRNIAALTAAAAAGLIYANVHTLTNPAGEVRGQLVPVLGTSAGGGGGGGAPSPGGPGY